MPGPKYRLFLPWILFIEIVSSVMFKLLAMRSYTTQLGSIHQDVLCNGRLFSLFFCAISYVKSFLPSGPYSRLMLLPVSRLLRRSRSLLIFFPAISKIKVPSKKLWALMFFFGPCTKWLGTTWKKSPTCKEKKKKRPAFLLLVFLCLFISNQNANWLSTNIIACFMLSTSIKLPSILPALWVDLCNLSWLQTKFLLEKKIYTHFVDAITC